MQNLFLISYLSINMTEISHIQSYLAFYWLISELQFF